jgi:hypothetical protein
MQRKRKTGVIELNGAGAYMALAELTVSLFVAVAGSTPNSGNASPNESGRLNVTLVHSLVYDPGAAVRTMRPPDGTVPP